MLCAVKEDDVLFSGFTYVIDISISYRCSDIIMTPFCLHTVTATN